MKKVKWEKIEFSWNQGCIFALLVERRQLLKISSMYFHYLVVTPFRKDMTLHLVFFKFPSFKGCFVSNLVTTGKMVMNNKILLRDLIVFSLCHYCLLLKQILSFIGAQPRMICVKFGWNWSNIWNARCFAELTTDNV